MVVISRSEIGLVKSVVLCAWSVDDENFLFDRGNWQGKKPFTKGPACSNCGNGAGWCKDGLCNRTSSLLALSSLKKISHAAVESRRKITWLKVFLLPIMIHFCAVAVLGKNIWGPGPSSFGRQQTAKRNLV